MAKVNGSGGDDTADGGEPPLIDLNEGSIKKLVARARSHGLRVVGFTRGLKSLAEPYVFCSVNTARPLLRLSSDQITYVLGKCKNPGDGPT